MSKEELAPYYEALVDLYAASFAGFPWFETLATQDVQKRIDTNATQDGFSFIQYTEDEQLVGAIWYDTPTLELLAVERGEDLALLARQLLQIHNLQSLVWEREVMVSPQHQGKGIATELRERMFDEIIAKLGPSLVLTRMRDDNLGIIKVAERCGFKRTGIKRPSSQTPDFMHEYWYKIVVNSESR